MSERLAGKVCIVTGGVGGIGEATARLFWEEGAAVALVDADRAAGSIDPTVNLLATAYCSKFAANAIVGRSNMGPYDASKAAVLALTRSMASEHVADNIRVNAVCPGPVLTSYHIRRRAARNESSLDEAETAMRAAGTSNLMKRFGEPREIAYSILFLASDESSYVTGATFMIDGGLSI